MQEDTTKRPMAAMHGAEHECIRGKDGLSYVVRPIRPTDAPSLMRGYDALSERSKWFRMLHALPHLSEEMAKKYCSPDPKIECCLVVEGQGELTGEILGGARISGIKKGADAEFSVSFRPEARGLGIARQALEKVIKIARQNGCRKVWGSIARQNLPMRKLAERIGFSLNGDPDDLSLLLAELEI